MPDGIRRTFLGLDPGRLGAGKPPFYVIVWERKLKSPATRKLWWCVLKLYEDGTIFREPEGMDPLTTSELDSAVKCNAYDPLDW